MNPAWPALTAERDRPTIVALHLFSQVLGKVPTALLPWRNHGWHLALHVTPRGLITEPIHAPGGVFTLALDLVDHQFAYEDAARRMTVSLGPMTVADFHKQVMKTIAKAGHQIRMHAAPNEVEPATPFADDHRTARLGPGQRHTPARRAPRRRPRLPPVPLRLPRQGQPGPFLLGQLRSGRHPLLRPSRPAPSGRHPASARRGDARGL